MLRIIHERLRQGHRTCAFPKVEPALPALFRGLPQLDMEKCGGHGAPSCSGCSDLCPFGAVGSSGGCITIDLGRCLFCADCPVCPHDAIKFSNDYRLATRTRKDLVFGGVEFTLAKRLDPKMLGLFGRSLKLRQVSAGGCNGCEADTNVLDTLVFDLGTLRYPVCGLAPSCRRHPGDRPCHAEHALRLACHL